MERICVALPILPGQTERLKEFEGARMGPRSKERDVFEHSLGTLRQIDWLLKTPQSDLVLIYYEASGNLNDLLNKFCGDQSDYARWVRRNWSEITGVDFNDLSIIQRVRSGVEEIFAYEAKFKANPETRPLAFAFPVVAGKSEAFREFYKTRTGARWQEEIIWRENVYKVAMEIQWAQKTPRGELLVVYIEWDGDLNKRIQEYAEYNDGYSLWVKGKLSEMTGIDLNKPFKGQLPEEIYTYEPKKLVTVPPA